MEGNSSSFSHFCFSGSSQGESSYNFLNLTYGCETQDKIVASFLLLYSLIGIPWNTLVLFVIIKNRLYQQPLIGLLLTLSATDIFILIFTLPTVITGFAGGYLFGSTDDVQCLVPHFFSITVTALQYGSTLIIVVMTIDRLLCVYKPFQYERLVTSRRTLIAIALIAAVCISIFLILYLTPQLLFVEYLRECASGYPKKVIILLLGLDVIVVLFLLICDMSVSYIALKHMREIYFHKLNESMNGKSKCCCLNICATITSKGKWNQVNRIICGFILPSLVISPLYIISYWTLYCIELDGNQQCAVKGLYIMYLCPTLIHPMLETWLIPEVYNTMKKMVTKGFKSDKAILMSKRSTSYSDTGSPSVLNNHAELSRLA